MIKDILLKQDNRQLYLATAEDPQYSYTTNRLNIYKFSENGFGDRITDPTTFGGTTNLYSVTFTSSGNGLLIGEDSPNLRLYQWSDTTGVGSLIDSVAPASSINGCTFSPNFAMTVANTSSPYLFGYQLSGSGFGTALTGADGSSSSSSVAINTAENAVAIAHNWVSFYVYTFSSSAFGTKFTSPSETNQAINKVKFSKSGDYIFTTYGAYLHAYPFNYSTGIGTKYATTYISWQTHKDIAVSPDGNFVAAALSNSPYIRVYHWDDSTHWGSAVSDPATLPTSAGKCIGFSKDGKYLAMGLTNSPYIIVYEWSASGFGAKFDNPATLPSTAISSLDWSYI